MDYGDRSGRSGDEYSALHRADLEIGKATKTPTVKTWVGRWETWVLFCPEQPIQSIHIKPGFQQFQLCLLIAAPDQAYCICNCAWFVADVGPPHRWGIGNCCGIDRMEWSMGRLEDCRARRTPPHQSSLHWSAEAGWRFNWHLFTPKMALKLPRDCFL